MILRFSFSLATLQYILARTCTELLYHLQESCTQKFLTYFHIMIRVNINDYAFLKIKLNTSSSQPIVT
jgi:hypothetical protein